MNVLEELTALRTQATTAHVQQLLDAEVAKVKADAKAVVQELHAHFTGAVLKTEEELKALWERFYKVL